MSRPAEERKREAAAAALGFVSAGEVLGVGTGSTAGFLIAGLGSVRARIDAVVASSVATERLLREEGFSPVGLSQSGPPTLYIDGADEVDGRRRMVKGGGGALTREKVLASAARRFVCIVDDSKCVDLLGAFPVPVEVLEFARSHVAARLAGMGGLPAWREGFVTDNGHQILDVSNLGLADALAVERRIDGIPGVVGNGIFAARPADVVVVAGDGGIDIREG